MTIQPIVEGYGEVAAVPVLLRRLLDEMQTYRVAIGRPIRKNRSELVSEASLRKAVRLALLQEGCAAVLVVFDADDDCPKELAPEIERWAREEAGDTPCAVVLPKCEFEAWFLGAIASLRGQRGIRADATAVADAETIRGAKERLESFLPSVRSYSETTDQPALAAVFDMSTAHRNCRSFRRMVGAFHSLAIAIGASPRVEAFPPPEWLT